MGLNSRVCRPSESHGLWLVHASSKPGMIESAVGTFSARKPSETPILPSLESLDVNIPWIRVLLNEGCFSFTSWTFPLWRCGILSFGGKIGLRQKKKHHTDSAPPTVDVSESPCQHNHDVTWCCAEGLWSKCKHICSHARPCILWLVNLEYCADPHLHDTSSNRAAAVDQICCCSLIRPEWACIGGGGGALETCQHSAWQQLKWNLALRVFTVDVVLLPHCSGLNEWKTTKNGNSEP